MLTPTPSVRRLRWTALALLWSASLALAGETISLFDGKSLAGWKQTEFDTQREVKVEPNFREGRGAIIIPATDYLCGITWKDESKLPAD